MKSTPLVYLIGGGLNIFRHLVSAEAAELGGRLVTSVPDLDVVVHAVVVILDLKFNFYSH